MPLNLSDFSRHLRYEKEALDILEELGIKPVSAHWNERALFKRGLITHETFLVITDPSLGFCDRWWTPRRGKYYKRNYHRACRRAWKGTGKKSSVRNWASELNWKGT